jgi:hypothetical protein
MSLFQDRDRRAAGRWTDAAVFLMILAAGYALERVVAARTGRRVLQ